MTAITFDHVYEGCDQNNGHPNYRFWKYWNDNNFIPKELNNYGYHTTDRTGKPYIQFDNENYPFPSDIEIRAKDEN